MNIRHINFRWAILASVAALAALMVGVAISSQRSGDGVQAQDSDWALGHITVSGSSSMSLPHDVGNIRLGVEVVDSTVRAARERVAVAMARVANALKEAGLTDDDIETLRFNIQPETVWVEEEIELPSDDILGQPSVTRRGRSVTIGFRVSNFIHVTVPEINRVGDIVDVAVEAGGDDIRIDSIYLSVQDSSGIGDGLRRAAALDAQAKAELYADTLGVILGPLTSLRENNTVTPVFRADVTFQAESAYGSPTQINPGESSFSASVTATFALLGPAVPNGQ